MTIITPKKETKIVGYTVEFTKEELLALLHFIGKTSTKDSLDKGLTRKEDDAIFKWFCKINGDEVLYA